MLLFLNKNSKWGSIQQFSDVRPFSICLYPYIYKEMYSYTKVKWLQDLPISPEMKKRNKWLG